MDKLIENYLKEITDYHKKLFAEKYDRLEPPQFEAKKGRRFVKIVEHRISNGKRYGASVYCFIDGNTGDIWKAASWSQPQKNGIRGNIHNAKKPLDGFDFYVR